MEALCDAWDEVEFRLRALEEQRPVASIPPRKERRKEREKARRKERDRRRSAT
jgi:hypothetical protein